MEITRIDLPVSTDLRMKNAGTKDSPMWVVAGPNADIAEAIKAGGVHVMTFRGPRVVLVDHVVRLADSLAIVPIDVDFSATATTTTAPVEDLTADQLRAALAKLEGDKGSATSTPKVTSSGRGRKPAASKTTTSKPAATTTKSAPAAAAVADVDAAELDSLLV